MRCHHAVPLVALLALAGCQAARPLEPGLPAATAAPAAPPVAILSTTGDAGVVHDGGIVFAKAPLDGYTIVGRLPVVHDGGIVFSRLLGVVAARAYHLQAEGQRQVRLTMASGRAMLTTPDADGNFGFAVKPRKDRRFNLLKLQIENEFGTAATIAYETGGGASQDWARLLANGRYDLGQVTEQVAGATPATNPLARLDADGDGAFDARDLDDDNDRVPDAAEVGAYTYDPAENHDNDHDGLGDRQDTDDDNDGIPDAFDPDDDGDLKPDATDDDDDNDGILDAKIGENPGHDLDRDGIPDEADADDDGDGLPDLADPDRDNDGILTEVDRDKDQDGMADDAEYPDSDRDGVIDRFDPKPQDPAVILRAKDFDWRVSWELFRDRDFDGLPSQMDQDDDGDGLTDSADPDRNNDGLIDKAVTGTPDTDADDDNNGLYDAPIDAGAWTADADGDGIPDWVDAQPDGAGAARPYGADGAEDDDIEDAVVADPVAGAAAEPTARVAADPAGGAVPAASDAEAAADAGGEAPADR